MRIIVDRIEENTAVVELPDKSHLNIPAILLEDAAEGDAVVITVEKKQHTQRTDTHSIFEKLRKKSESNE